MVNCVEGRLTNANPQSHVSVCPQLLLNVPQPVLPAVAPFRSHAEFAERKVDVVANHEQIFDRDFVEVENRPHGPSAQVHEGQWLDKQNRFVAFLQFRDERLKLLAER